MKIAFQGAKGAYSDMAARQIFPDTDTCPCMTFEDAFDAVKNGDADIAVIPIDNTLAGRVADVHHLLPDSGLSIIGEHFLPIRHCLLGIKGANLKDISHVHSHVHALPQCRKFIREHGLTSVVHADTAGAAQDISELQNPTQAAIASALAADIYGLDILAEGIQDDDTNTTRFIVLSPTTATERPDDAMTALTFEVRNIPAALYKALGVFATNGLNMMKLESYVDHQFQAARFYCEVAGHPDDLPLKNALEELGFYAKDVKILGTFAKSPLRKTF